MLGRIQDVSVSDVCKTCFGKGGHGEPDTDQWHWCPDCELHQKYLDRKSSSGIVPEDSAWPVNDVLAKLVEAAEILLYRHDYDGHGYEEILAAVDAAKKTIGAAE